MSKAQWVFWKLKRLNLPELFCWVHEVRVFNQDQLVCNIEGRWETELEKVSNFYLFVAGSAAFFFKPVVKDLPSQPCMWEFRSKAGGLCGRTGIAWKKSVWFISFSWCFSFVFLAIDSWIPSHCRTEWCREETALARRACWRIVPWPWPSNLVKMPCIDDGTWTENPNPCMYDFAFGRGWRGGEEIEFARCHCVSTKMIRTNEEENCIQVLSGEEEGVSAVALAEEKEEEPHEAVAIAVKATSVEDVQLSTIRRSFKEFFSQLRWKHNNES